MSIKKLGRMYWSITKSVFGKFEDDKWLLYCGEFSFLTGVPITLLLAGRAAVAGDYALAFQLIFFGYFVVIFVIFVFSMLLNMAIQGTIATIKHFINRYKNTGD